MLHSSVDARSRSIELSEGNFTGTPVNREL
jgi:hypothetical protein